MGTRLGERSKRKKRKLWIDRKKAQVRKLIKKAK